MELGALVCTLRNPQCRICPVKKLCVAFRDNRVEELPNLGKRDKTTARRFVAFVVKRNGKCLVRQRPAGVVNAHLWEFPNVEVGARPCEPLQNPQFKASLDLPVAKLVKLLRVGDPRSIKLKPLITVKHSITRYRITLDAFRVSFGGTGFTSRHSEKTKSGTRGTCRSENAGVWKSPAQVQSLAFTSAHRKVLGALTDGAAR